MQNLQIKNKGPTKFECIKMLLMVKGDLRLSRILTKEAFINAIITNAAIGGSTNQIL